MAKLNMKKIQDSLVNRGLAGAAGGAVAQFVGDKLPASINPMVKNVGTVVLGAIIPELSPKTKFLEGAGAGMAGVGGANLLKSMMSGAAAKSEVNGLEDEGWTETAPIHGLPMDDDDDMNGIGDKYEVDDEDDDINGADDVTQE
jgi:hypothetical protein